VRLFVTGNPDWLVPAGFEERRFAVFDVGDDKRQDHAYFGAIVDQLNNGGREALLHYLLNFDLSTVDLRSVPKTGALLEQKFESLSPDDAWWLDTLMRGELPWGCAEQRCCPKRRLFDNYARHAQMTGARRRATETKIGMFLNKQVPQLRSCERSVMFWSEARQEMREQNDRCYEFPPLDDCRSAFTKRLQQ